MEENDIHLPTLIVGGGICGSYLGLQMLEQNYTSFLILEAVGMYRGKQKSVKVYPYANKDPEIIEMGSSVFHTEQDHLLGLLHYLQLEDQIQRLDPSMKAFYTYPGLTTKDAKTLFTQLKTRLLQQAIAFPKDGKPSLLTVDHLSKQLFTTEEYNILSGCWPEWYEMKDQNAYSVAISEKYTGHWCKLQYGLEQILDRAADLLDEHLQWFQPVTRIEKRNETSFRVFTQGRTYQCDKLYLCSNLRSLQEDIELVGFTSLPKYLELGTYVPCMRVYIVLKRDLAASLSRPTLIESLSGPPVKNGWRAKYSLQVSPRVWLISYPDGPLVEEIYDKLLSGQLVDEWIEDMNRYFNLRLTRDDIQDIPEVTMWGDAYTILNPQWYQPEAPKGILHDGVMVTCLPKPYHQAWMEGHLYQLPGMYHQYQTQFVQVCLQWIQDHQANALVGPFHSCTIMPIVNDTTEQILWVRENSGPRKGSLNPIGGKVVDKYFPDTQGALYAAFEELAEEGHLLVSNAKALYDSILCIDTVIVNQGKRPEEEFKCICIGLVWKETANKMVEWWKSELLHRQDLDFLPSRWLEIEEMVPRDLMDSTTLDYYPKRMLATIQKYRSSLSGIQGLRLGDTKSITFNRLALPVVH